MWLGMVLCSLKFLATFLFADKIKVTGETNESEIRENYDKKNMTQVENTLELNPQINKKRFSLVAPEGILTDKNLDQEQTKIKKVSYEPGKSRNISPELNRPSILVDNNISLTDEKIHNSSQSNKVMIEDSNYGLGIKFYNPLLVKYLKKANERK